MLGIGVFNIDIVDFQTRTDGLNQKSLAEYFTAEEREHCLLSRRALSSFAAFFAAKSALFKALPDLSRFNPGWHDLEIVNTSDQVFSFGGRVVEYLKKMGIDKVHLSFSQSSASAVAFVVVERG